jgi:hypothetical protein
MSKLFGREQVVLDVFAYIGPVNAINPVGLTRAVQVVMKPKAGERDSRGRLWAEGKRMAGQRLVRLTARIEQERQPWGAEGKSKSFQAFKA